MFVGCLGVEGNQLLEALAKIGYSPKRHFYLYPSPLLASYGPADRATSLTNFEDVAPFTSSPEAAEFAKAFEVKFNHKADYHAASGYTAGVILQHAIEGTKSIDDAKLADWLDKNSVDTVAGKRDFKGLNHTSSTDAQEIRQVQNGRWVSVFPQATATPGVKLMAP